MVAVGCNSEDRPHGRVEVGLIEIKKIILLYYYHNITFTFARPHATPHAPSLPHSLARSQYKKKHKPGLEPRLEDWKGACTTTALLGVSSKVIHLLDIP